MQQLERRNTKPKSDKWCRAHSESLKVGYQTGKIKPIQHSDETKEQISNKLQGKYIGKENPMFGKKRPDVSEMNKQRVNPMYGKHHSEESKEQISKSLSEGYANGEIKINNQFETGHYNDEWYASSYELKYMKFLDGERIDWTKKHGIAIPYLWNNATRHYIPDFLEYRDRIMITEVKGRLTEKDEEKFRALGEYCETQKYDCQLITLENGKWIKLVTKAGGVINTNIKNVEMLKYGKGIQWI